LLVTSAKGRIVFDKKVIQYEHFKELNEFSHIWVLFMFHENTNEDKAYLSSSGRGSGSSKLKGVSAKISPPRLHGVKVGCLSTRSPHRPNPIGLSVCEVISVQPGFIEISGVDMIKGTPVLDIKPYIPYDIVPSSISLPMLVDINKSPLKLRELNVPKWIFEADVPLRDVIFEKKAKDSLKQIVDRNLLCTYYTEQELITLVSQVLIQDIRSIKRGRGLAVKERDPENYSSEKVKEENLTGIDMSSKIFDAVDAIPYLKDSSHAESSYYEVNIDNLNIKFQTFNDKIIVVRVDTTTTSRS